MVFRRYCLEVLQRLREQVCRQHRNYCGTRTNWFTMTECRCTLLVLLQQQFLGAEIMAVFPQLSGLHLRLVIYSCFREWNRSYDDVVSRISLKFKNTHWLCYTRFWRVPVVRETLDPLHEFELGLLWRQQQQTITKINVINPFRNFCILVYLKFISFCIFQK